MDQTARRRISVLFAPHAALLFYLLSIGPVAAQSANDGDLTLFLSIALITSLFYFVPTMVAFYRRHPNRWAILVLNAAFGATGLGWLGSLVWAFSAAHISPTGSNGGESGLNLFVNDPARPTRAVGDGREVNVLAQNAVPSVDPLDRLTQLLALRESGAIDDTEFATLKSRFLQ